MYEGGHRVPAIASWPGYIDVGVTTNATAMTMDLFPTFLELAGIDTASEDGIGPVDGESLTPLLLRNEAPPRRMLFWRIKDDKAVRDGDWKLVVKKSRMPELDHDAGRSVLTVGAPVLSFGLRIGDQRGFHRHADQQITLVGGLDRNIQDTRATGTACDQRRSYNRSCELRR